MTTAPHLPKRYRWSKLRGEPQAPWWFDAYHVLSWDAWVTKNNPGDELTVELNNGQHIRITERIR